VTATGMDSGHCERFSASDPPGTHRDASCRAGGGPPGGQHVLALAWRGARRRPGLLRVTLARMGARPSGWRSSGLQVKVGGTSRAQRFASADGRSAAAPSAAGLPVLPTEAQWCYARIARAPGAGNLAQSPSRPGQLEGKYASQPANAERIEWEVLGASRRAP
jgi:hypothetical protein